MGTSACDRSSIEPGRYNPSLSLAFRLAQVFDLTIEYVFAFEANGNSAE